MARTITTHNSGEREMVGEHYNLTRSIVYKGEWDIVNRHTGIALTWRSYEQAYQDWCHFEGVPSDMCSECGETREIGALCMDCYVSAMFRQAAV